MGKAIEIVTVRTTAAGASGVAGTALAGNSLTIRNGNRPAQMVAAWRTGQAAGFVRLTSPYLHDAMIGTDLVVPTGQSALFFGVTGGLTLQPQDQLVVTMAGSATAGDMEHVSMLIYYPDLPGVDAHLITADEFRRRVIDFYASKNTITTTTTGEYTGAEAITAEQDGMKAKAEYAVVGISVSTGVHCLRYSGPDFGNLGIGLPAIAANSMANGNLFIRLAAETGLPLIPVVSSANKSLTMIDAATDENGADPIASTIFARLR